MSISESSGADSVPLVSTAASAPAANSSESPGRNGVTTKPVSANTMRNRISVDPEAVVAQQLDEVGVEMQDEIDEPVDQLQDHFHARRHFHGVLPALAVMPDAGLGLRPFEQLERRVHAGIAACQRLAHARVVEIERHAVDVLERVVRLDAAALDGAARRREVTRSRELDGAALRERHHRLHRALAEGAPAQQHGAVVILQRAGEDFGRRSRGAVHQHDHRHARQHFARVSLPC